MCNQNYTLKVTFSLVKFIVSGRFVLCFTYTYMYEFETSFINISSSSDPILITFTQPFQQVTESLNIDFQGILIILQNLLILLCNVNLIGKCNGRMIERYDRMLVFWTMWMVPIYFLCFLHFLEYSNHDKSPWLSVTSCSAF